MGIDTFLMFAAHPHRHALRAPSEVRRLGAGRASTVRLSERFLLQAEAAEHVWLPAVEPPRQRARGGE